MGRTVVSRRFFNQGRVVRAVLWVGLVCALLPAAYLWRVHSTRTSVAWLHSLDARIFWDHDSRAADPLAFGTLKRLVASSVGPEYLSVITTAEIDNEQADDAQLSRLSSLKRLEILRLNSHECSDATIARISRLSRLRELSITGQQVSFQGLLELRKLTRLKSLRLSSMSLSKGELAVLAAALPWVDLNYNEGIENQRYVRKVADRFPRLASNSARENEPRFETLFQHNSSHQQQRQGGVTLRPMAFHDQTEDHNRERSQDRSYDQSQDADEVAQAGRDLLLNPLSNS